MMRYATSILITLLFFRTNAQSERHLRKIELNQERQSDASLPDTKPSLGAPNVSFKLVPIKGEELSQVSLNKNAKNVWGVNSKGDIFQRNGEDGSWKSISGTLKQVSVSGNSNHIFGCNSDRDVYYRFQNTGNWEQMKGEDLVMLSVNYCGNVVWGVNTGKQPVYRAGNKRNSEWKRVTDKKMKYTAVSGNGKLVLGLDTSGFMYFRKGPGPNDGSWKKIKAGGSDSNFITVSTDMYGSNIWAVDENKKLWYLKGKDASSFKQMGKGLRDVSVSQDSKHLWLVDEDNDVWASTSHPVNAVHDDDLEEGCAHDETTSLDTTVDEEKTELV